MKIKPIHQMAIDIASNIYENPESEGKHRMLIASSSLSVAVRNETIYENMLQLDWRLRQLQPPGGQFNQWL